MLCSLADGSRGQHEEKGDWKRAPGEGEARDDPGKGGRLRLGEPSQRNIVSGSHRP